MALDSKVVFLRETYNFDRIDDLCSFLRQWYAVHQNRHVQMIIMLKEFNK